VNPLSSSLDSEALILEMAPGRRERCRDDVLFDRFLPANYRDSFRHFWTPLGVAARVARWLDELAIARVVDVGSGVGKFCIAGALASRSSFVGIEQRSELVGVSRGISERLGLERRVSFIDGAFGEVTLPTADCYYFFNPFAEAMLPARDRLHDGTHVGMARSLRDVSLAEGLLQSLSSGTYVVTYNGFGGKLPDDYRIVRSSVDYQCALYLARKR
jgi:hypothetical protein